MYQAHRSSGTAGPGKETKLTHLVMLSIGAAFPKNNFVWKFHASEFDPPGIPDIIGSINGRFVGLECKMEGNRYSDFQKAKMRLISAAGGVACGVMQMDDGDVWLHTCNVVQEFTLRDRSAWMALPHSTWRDGSGTPHPVLSLSALKILLGE